MTGVARGEGCFPRGSDAGDLAVTDIDRPSNLPLSGSDWGRFGSASETRITILVPRSGGMIHALGIVGSIPLFGL